MKKIIIEIFIGLILCCNAVIIFAQKPMINGSSYEWVMTFEDNFDGKDLNWEIWSSDDSKYLKNETYRDKYCIEVENGELRLYVKKESFNKSKWRAASIYLNEVLENNSYVECRFRSTQCSGVNNAFWLANKTSPFDVYRNRYEIDIVEARYNVNTQKGAGHIAWHDWKTYSYTKNEDGKNFDIAQGIQVDHDFDEYHTWGLWYGENEIIIYLDGVQVWDGKTSARYPDQWWTGVGKAKAWNPIEEKRAYGKFGQDDWSYQAGYNGDRLNVMLSTLPWGEAFTPLTNEADGKYMAVDYVRIFKPKHLLEKKPVELIKNVNKAVLFDNTYRLDQDTCIYFSVLAEKQSSGPLDLRFVDGRGHEVFILGIDLANNLSVLVNGDKRSTANVYPAIEEEKQDFEIGGKYLLVGRVTAHQGKGKYDRDAVSFSVFDMNGFPVKREPYFYPNIDQNGNTSITNEWHINAKDYLHTSLKSVQIRGNWKLNDFKVGYNFLSILPEKWHGAIAQLGGCKMVKAGENVTFDVLLEGKTPFSLSYTINGELKKIEKINSNKYSLRLKPKENQKLELTDVFDTAGVSGSVFGKAYVVMSNKKQTELKPIFDTYVMKDKEIDFSNYQHFELKGDPHYEREIYVSFDLAEGIPRTGSALFFIYCVDNQKKLPLSVDVYAVNTDKPPSIIPSLNLPNDFFSLINSITLEGDTNGYVGCDLKNIAAKYITEGRRYLTLKLKFSKGDETNLIKFMQGHGQSSNRGPKLVFIDKLN